MRKTAIRKDKRTRLQRSFQQTVFKLYKKKNLDEITVNEVCDKIGVPRSSFYYHYTMIREVIEEAESDIISELAANYKKAHNERGNEKECFLDLFRTSIPVIKANEQFFKTVMNIHQDFYFVEKWSNEIENHLENGLQNSLRGKVLAHTLIFSIGDILALGLPLDEMKGEIIYEEAESICPFKKRLLDL